MPRKKAAKKKTARKRAPAKNKIKHISWSQIDAARCLYYYQNVYLKERYPEADTAPKIAGHCAHKIIFDYTRYLYTQRIDSDFDAMEKIINTNFKAYNLPETEYRPLRGALLDFGERGVIIENLLGMEKETTIEFLPGMFFKAIIDRINGYRLKAYGSCLEIIDYKNHNNILSKTDVEKSEQLDIYKYICCKFLFPGYDHVRVGIHHIQYNYVVFSDWQKIANLEKDFENMGAYLARQWQRIRQETEYPAQRCINCGKYGGCPILHAGDCPLYTTAQMNKIINGQDVGEMVRLYRQADAVRAAVLARLKEFVQENGPVLVDGKLWGYTISESYKYDIGMALEFCRKYNIPTEKIKSFNKADFEKAIKAELGLESYRGLLDEIGPMRIYEKATRFKS